MRTYLQLKNVARRQLPPEFQQEDVRYPETLVEYFLKGFTRAGDVVLDPFAGYGTTLQVAEELGRVAWGIEFSEDRAEYIRSQLKHPDQLLSGDARRLSSYALPAFDLLMTSPPFAVYEGDGAENPLTNYTTRDGSYPGYLRDLQRVFAQARDLMKPGAHVVIEASNLKGSAGVVTQAWDVARAVAGELTFEGEVVVGWDRYGYGYDHSYCLIFSRP